MDKLEREALQVCKEITVKFIESQRISPANFAEIFPALYKVVLQTILREHDSISPASITEK